VVNAGSRIAFCAFALLAPVCSGAAGSVTGIPVKHRFAGAPLALHSPVVREGKTIAVTRLEYLVSGLRVEAADGAWHRATETVALLNPAEDRVTLPTAGLPPRPWRRIAFDIGVQPGPNHGDTAQWPPDHPLHPLSSNLHWDWRQGYVFIAIEGTIRDAATPRAPFLYHVGGGDLLREVSMEIPPPLADQPLAIAFDLDRIWSGAAAIDPLEDGGFTHSREGDPLARRLADNLAGCFSVVANAQ